MNMKNIQEITPGRWRVQIRRKGFKKFGKVFESLELALATRDTELAVRAPVDSGGDVTLRECYELFKHSDMFDGYSHAHRKKIEQNWRLAIADELGDLPMAFFAESGCKRRLVLWREQRAKAKKVHGTGKYSAHALRLERASLTAILEYAVDNGWLLTNPIRDIRPTRRKNKKTDEKAQQQKRLSPDDEGAIALAYQSEFMGDRIKEACRFFLFQRDTAARGGELRELPKSCINLDGKPPRMFLPATKDTQHLTDGGGRELPLSPFSVHLIAEQLVFSAVQGVAHGVESPLLFSTWGNRILPHGWRPYNEQSAVKTLRNEEIVSAKYKPHGNRAEWVTRARERGLDSRTIMAQTGHKSEQSLVPYDNANKFAPEMLGRLEKEGKNTQEDRNRALAKMFGIPVEELTSISSAVSRLKRENKK